MGNNILGHSVKRISSCVLWSKGSKATSLGGQLCTVLEFHSVQMTLTFKSLFVYTWFTFFPPELDPSYHIDVKMKEKIVELYYRRRW